MLLQPAINQENLAYFRALNLSGLAGWALACRASFIQPVPRSHIRECTSFRTLFPYGQLKRFNLELSSFSGRCMYKARESIQPWRDFAIGSSARRVTQNCLGAYYKNLNAFIVPLFWGGFLCFPIPFQFRHLQKDITCSTKS